MFFLWAGYVLPVKIPWMALCKRWQGEEVYSVCKSSIQKSFRRCFDCCGINCWHIRSFAVDTRGTRRLIPVGGSRPWLDDRIGIPPGRDAKIVSQNCRMSGYVSRWNKGGLHMFTWARSCNIAAICIKMFSGSGEHKKMLELHPYAKVPKGFAQQVVKAGCWTATLWKVWKVKKGQSRIMHPKSRLKSTKQIMIIHDHGFKTESLHSLLVFEFIYLDGWSFVFFDPGLFGTWTHPATNRVRLGWICATDFFQHQQLKAKRNLGKAVQDAATRKGLKYDSTKPEGKLEKETYSREWARCTQGNWRT